MQTKFKQIRNNRSCTEKIINVNLVICSASDTLISNNTIFLNKKHKFRCQNRQTKPCKKICLQRADERNDYIKSFK